MKRYSFGACMMVGMSLLYIETASAQVYQLTPLPIQYAEAMNDSGVIIGSSYGYSYIIDKGVAISIGGLYPGGSSVALGLNNLRQVVGYANPSNSNPYGHAFRWQDNVMTDLGVQADISSWATCINDLGDIAGIIFDSTANRLFILKKGVVTILGTLGQEASSAEGINNLGQVVGSSRLNDTIVHAFLWENGSMTDLGTLGGENSEAKAINNLGHVVGSSYDASNNRIVAALWNGSAPINLGYIAMTGDSYYYSAAFDINNTGVIVGTSTWNSPTYYCCNNHAFIWKNGVITDLNAVTDTSGGWELLSGVGITDNGDIVCTAVNRAYPNYVQSVLLKGNDLLLLNPKRDEYLTSGDDYTIRWKSGLPPNALIALQLSLDSGKTWSYLAGPIPADSEKHILTVPDTFSAKAQIRIYDAGNPALGSTGELFKIRNYHLRKLSQEGDYIAYNPANDFWRFKNSDADIWRQPWYTRFDYDGIDPFTNKSYKSGERVSTRIFSLAQSSDFPDWPSFVRAFGTGTCYLNIQTPIYSPTAVTLWESKKGNYRGSCFGLALSNALAFRHPNNFHSRYPNFPDFSIPFLVDPDSLSLPAIHELFTHQYGQQHKTYLENIATDKTPTQTLNELKAMLLDESQPIRTLRLVNTGGASGAHAVLAYKIVPDEILDETYHVYIYENNNPNSQAEKIIIYTFTNNGNGSWDAPSAPGWGGTRGIQLRDDAFTYFNNPLLPKASSESPTSPFTIPPNKVEIDVAGDGNVRIEDNNGDITGYIDSLLYEEIPGSLALIVDNGSKAPPYGYSLPSGPYSVTAGNFTSPDTRFYFFSGDTTFRILHKDATASQTDRLFFDGSLSIVNPDTIGKNFDLFTITKKFTVWQYQYQWLERVFSIRSLALSQSDSVRIENIGDGGFKLSLFGLDARTYDLDIELAAYMGSKYFNHASVVLEGNSSHVIQPIWTSLGDSVLKIFIDHGNDGTIDDSLVVDHQVTGVKDPLVKEIPAEFELHQNYPNPFNPATTIEYIIPTASFVTLKVFDVLGREVTALVSEQKQPGVYTSVWEATDVPSGMYFYKLTAGAFTSVKKMILLK